MMLPWMETLLETTPFLLGQVTLVLAIALAWTSFSRRASAASRHLVWIAALVACLALPMRMAVAPTAGLIPLKWTQAARPTASSFDVLADRETKHSRPISERILLATAGPVRDLSQSSPLETHEPAQSTSTRPAMISRPALVDHGNIAAGILAVWLIGSALALLPVLLGHYRLRQRARHATVLTGPHAALLGNLAQTIGVRRPVQGLIAAEAVMPMTWGVLYPVVLLPSDAVNWSADRLRIVLLHELGHIRRADCLTQTIGLVARAIYWFHPLAWLAVRRLRIEQEAACDDGVLRLGTAAPDYASELLAVTSRAPQSLFEASVALAMSRTTRIESRLRAILNEDVNRRPASRLQTGAIALAFAVLATTIVFGSGSSRAEETTPSAPATPAAPAPHATSPAAVPANDGDAADNNPVATSTDQQPKPAADDGPGNAGPKPLSREVDPDVDYVELKRLLEVISTHSAQPTVRTKLREAAIDGMIESLGDPYTALLTPELLGEITQVVDSSMVGIGVALEKKGDSIAILSVLAGSPAFTARLKPGENIVSINGVKPTSVMEAAKAIRGPEGTDVVLKLARAGGMERQVTFRRTRIEIPTVRGVTWSPESGWRHRLDPDSGIGYIAVTSFSKRTGEEFEQVLARLKQDGLKGLVLDLRRNPGGILQESLRIAQLFVPNADVVKIMGRDDKQSETIRTGANSPYADLPLVVVVDGSTGSAAEILAAALQENKRAVIVGERTIGKGSIQSILPLSETTAIRLTTHLIATPSGRLLNRNPDAVRWGVDPDDGHFIPCSLDERRKWAELLVTTEAGQVKLPERLTAEGIREALADTQLAGAVTALEGRIKTGQYTAAGRPLAEQQARLDVANDLRKRRDELRKEIERLDQALGGKP